MSTKDDSQSKPTGFEQDSVELEPEIEKEEKSQEGATKAEDSNAQTVVPFQICDVASFSGARRFGEMALHTEIVLGLQEKGYVTASRYQQAILSQVLKGNDCWINARLSSNRGVAFGAYLADAAFCGGGKPSVLVCSVISEVRRNLSQDIADWSIFTGVEVAVLQMEIAEEDTVNIAEDSDVLVASPTNLWRLYEQEKLDLSNVTVLYLDEAEKMCSPEQATAVSNLLRVMSSSPQVIVQTTRVFSDTYEVISSWKPSLQHPIQLEKKTEEQKRRYVVTEEYSFEKLCALLDPDLYGRSVIVCEQDEQVEEICLQLAQIGWEIDILRSESHPKQRERNERKLKDGTLQILGCTEKSIASIQTTEPLRFVVVSFGSAELLQQLHEKVTHTASELIAFGVSEEQKTALQWSDLSIPSVSEAKQSRLEHLLDGLQRNSMRMGFQRYEELVQELLQQPNGHSLLAVALQQGIQRDRMKRLEMRDELQRLESKDLFQRRRGKPRRGSGRRKPQKRR